MGGGNDGVDPETTSAMASNTATTSSLPCAAIERLSIAGEQAAGTGRAKPCSNMTREKRRNLRTLGPHGGVGIGDDRCDVGGEGFVNGGTCLEAAGWRSTREYAILASPRAKKCATIACRCPANVAQQRPGRVT